MSNLEILGERVRSRRIDMGMSQADLALRAGYSSRSSINKVEKGIVDIPQSKIKLLAEILSVSEAWLMGYDVPMERAGSARPSLPDYIRPVKRKKFPVLGNVACGEPIWAEEEHGAFVDGAVDIDADFCLVAKGDSMINARIFDGDVLFVKRQEMVDNGEIAVVLVDNEATVKRVYYDKENNVITLVPENPTHKPLRYEGQKLDEIAILGKVVAGQFVVR